MPITPATRSRAAINSYHSVVVAAAGNDAVASPSYPAACPGAIGVAATDQSDAPAYFSNYGSPNVFVSAPGVNILSTYPGAFDCSPDPVGYCTESGTSMASPLVTALAALIRTEHPEATVGQVRQMLAENSDKVGPGPYVTAPVGTCSAAPGSSTTATDGSTSSARSRQPCRRSLLRRLPRRPRRRRHRLLRRLRRPTRRLPRFTSTRLALARVPWSDFATECTTTRARRPRQISVYRRTRALRQLTRAAAPDRTTPPSTGSTGAPRVCEAHTASAFAPPTPRETAARSPAPQSAFAEQRAQVRAAATSAASSATSVGVVPTRTPRSSSASFLACAVPAEPEMIAPAWPIVFPGGAVKPAM